MSTLVGTAFTVARGLVYSAGFVWLWAWLAVSVRSYDARLAVTLPTWLVPIGVVVAIAGGAVAAICIATFVTTGRGTPAPFDPPREFVATGPYRYVRNPMYVGAAVTILGAGLAVSSPSIVALAASFVANAHVFVIAYEEPALRRTFGASYDDYRASVRRWVASKPNPARS